MRRHSATPAGLAFRLLRSQADIMGAVAEARVVSKGGGLQATARALARIANENIGAWLDAIVEAGESADAVIGAGLAAFAAFSAAERVGAKTVGAGMISITPTAEFPSPFLPVWTPRLFNRASGHFVNAMLWRAFRERTNAARARHDLPQRRSVWTDLPMIYRRLACAYPAAHRLAGRRAAVWAMARAAARLDAARAASALPRRGGSAYLYWLRQHDRLRLDPATGR